MGGRAAFGAVGQGRILGGRGTSGSQEDPCPRESIISEMQMLPQAAIGPEAHPRLGSALREAS